MQDSIPQEKLVLAAYDHMRGYGNPTMSLSETGTEVALTWKYVLSSQFRREMTVHLDYTGNWPFLKVHVVLYAPEGIETLYAKSRSVTTYTHLTELVKEARMLM